MGDIEAQAVPVVQVQQRRRSQNCKWCWLTVAVAVVVAGIVVIVMKPWEQSISVGGVEVKTSGFSSFSAPAPAPAPTWSWFAPNPAPAPAPAPKPAPAPEPKPAPVPAPAPKPAPNPAPAPQTTVDESAWYQPSANDQKIEGSYQISYSWSRGYTDAGYYYPDGTESYYGWYKFFNQADSDYAIGDYKELYRFEYYPKQYNYKQKTVTIYYAPIYGGDSDHYDSSYDNLLHGLYHNDNSNTLLYQKGYYRLMDGDYTEVGVFYYIKTGLYGGAGTLEDAVFSYLYYPYTRSDKDQWPEFRRE